MFFTSNMIISPSPIKNMYNWTIWRWNIIYMPSQWIIVSNFGQMSQNGKYSPQKIDYGNLIHHKKIAWIQLLWK
jgi:hypothetical protein